LIHRIVSITYPPSHTSDFRANIMYSYSKSPAPSSAFLTVSISHPVPDWLAPGKDDPIIAFVLKDTALEAEKSAPPRSKLAHDLIIRSQRLFDQGMRMEPRGQRIPWWHVPPLPKELVALENGTVSLGLPGAANTTATGSATAKRRKRVYGSAALGR